ncbi:MAG: YlxR family protein [Clostridia bacterium]|nr:YlxR family protein [Clostridia bacterium]
MSENANKAKKKQPERQCMGCNAKKPKNELIRIVRGTDGSVELDFTGKKAGRGAYICHDASCLAKIRRSGRVGRVLEVNLTDEVWAALEEEISLDG